MIIFTIFNLTRKKQDFSKISNFADVKMNALLHVQPTSKVKLLLFHLSQFLQHFLSSFFSKFFKAKL